MLRQCCSISAVNLNFVTANIRPEQSVAIRLRVPEERNGAIFPLRIIGNAISSAAAAKPRSDALKLINVQILKFTLDIKMSTLRHVLLLFFFYCDVYAKI